MVEQHENESWLKLRLPLTAKGDVRLLTSGDELVVHVGPHKRNVILPRALADQEPLGAKFEGDTLIVRFSRRP